MRVLNNVCLTGEEREFIISLIENFGDGTHPCADENNIGFFTVEYVKDLLVDEEYLHNKSNLTNKGLKIAIQVEEKFKNL